MNTFDQIRSTSEINSMTYTVGNWASRTFPNATKETIIAHLREELDELEKADTPKEMAVEMADIILLTMHLAYRNMVLLGTITTNKFVVNKARIWKTEPEKEGHIKHIKDLKENISVSSVTGDPKYNIYEGKIINSSTGKPIPDNEPVFILRAQDKKSTDAILHYQRICDNFNQKDKVGDIMEKFIKYQLKDENSDRLKEPDTHDI